VVLLVYFFLRIIGWETKFIDSILEWFGAQRNLGSIEFNWGEIVIFFLVIWLSVYVSNIVRSVLEEDILNKMKLEKGLPHTISMMARYTLITIGIFLAVSAAGIPFSDFAIIFGAFGVGIGFGLQNIFNNLVSGLILLFERPIKIGDTIEVGQLMGNVRSIGIRSSNVRTFDGAEIIVPNGNLISNEVINWTLSDQTRRIEVIVGVSYSSDPHKVQEILLNVLSSHKEIVQNPEPNVYFRDLGESSLDFRMLCWTERFDQWVRIKSEIIFMVFDALKEANIEIPFPQRDLHVRSVNPNIKLSNEGAKKQE
jgi:small-conductance mechanosensitive channel